MQREQIKKTILDDLCSGKSYSDVATQLKAIEQSATITERLLEAFPGYYGRFICLHFMRFLNEPIATLGQKQAFKEIMDFLDNVPQLDFPKALQEYLTEYTKHISNEDINSMVAHTKQSIENTEKFLSENKEMLDQYLAYKQSEEYKNSPAYALQKLLKEFNGSSGYYDVFIPAMKRLSTSYADYSKQIEIANEKLLAQYPEIAELDSEMSI